MYEGFLKEWILKDIHPNLDRSQYGNEAGTGTDHLLLAFVDKVLKLLDTTESYTAVVAAMVDWRSAFDRQDPTLAIKKFLKLGLSPSLVQILVSYLQNRKMTVKFNEKTSETYDLPGGGPQGTLIGGIEYSVQSNDNADFLEDDERYKYVHERYNYIHERNKNIHKDFNYSHVINKFKRVIHNDKTYNLELSN